MSKRVKFITKIISLILTVIMVLEVSPTSALAAFVTNISGNADNTIEESYDESRNFYYDYHSIDVGRAGTLSINDYTLTPSLSFDALGIDGNIFPVNISMKYNSSEYRFLKEIVGYTPTAYGNGWLTNYSSMLCELQYEDKTQLAYLSGTGAVILFEQTELSETDTDLPAGTTKWVMPEFDDVYIYKVTDAVANADATLAQHTMHTDGAVRVFDKYGRMISCVNTAASTSNTIHYQYNDGTNLEDITEIIDGVGNEYRFTYTDGLLTKIKCYTSDGTAIIVGDGENAAPLEMNFAYTSGNLATVTFPDGKSVSYDYNSSGNMLRATNIDGNKAEITYTDGYASKLAEHALDESNTYVAGSYIDITWDGNTRTFTDNNSEVQIKTFDDTGKILTIVDGDGNYLYSEPVAEEESSTGAAEEESSTDVIEEESSIVIPEEDSSEYIFSVCPCSECTEWNCSCECASEDICTCIQCKRYSDTVEDASGNVLSEESFDGVRTMKTQNTYTSDGNYLSSSVDTSGNIVYYVYDEAGFMQSMTSGEMEVLFDYDAMGNLTQLSQQNSNVHNGYYATNGIMSNVYTYTDDKVTSITHNGFSYDFTYDEWGNQTSIKIGENLYQSYEYDSANDYRLTKINYANGQSITYSYDENDNITGVSYDNGQTFAYIYEYDSDSVLTKVTDNQTGLITTYTASAVEIRNAADNSLVYSSVTNEDGTETETIDDFDITYSYNSEYNQVTGKTTSSKSFSKYYLGDGIDGYTEYDMDVGTSSTTDWFGRVESKNVSMDVQKICEGTGPHENYIATGTQAFTYADTETTASTKITSHSSSYVWNGNNFFSKTEYYEYDDSGNITGIYRIEDDKKVYYHQYTYDEAGQLYSEYNYLRDEFIIYFYDAGGNIASKNVYDGWFNGWEYGTDVPNVTYEYAYEDTVWKDKLTTYTNFDPYCNNPRIHYPITYDAMGNMTSFNGSILTWTAGRQLSTLTTADGELYSFTYNENGYLSKIEKSVDGAVEYTEYYTWNGEKLINYRKVEGYWVDESYILYDEQGEAYGLVRNEIMVYLFNRNLQGDITEIIEPDFGFVGAEYRYDAYGNYVVKDPESSWYSGDMHAEYVDAAVPFTYRGYLDINIGDYHLYYLGSRFYSPQLGRFINADIYVDTGTGVNGTNLFAYCNNNPVMFYDPTGETGFLIGIQPYHLPIKDDFKYNPKAKATTTAKLMWNMGYHGANALKKLYPEGVDFYMYYRSGKGGTYYYDYLKAIEQDKEIAKKVVGVLLDLQFKTQEIVIHSDTDYLLTSVNISVRPKSMNWKLAIGEHQLVVYACVGYSSNIKKYYMQCIIVGYDRYNFHKDTSFAGIKAEWNGQFVTLGWAKNFTSIGSTSVYKTWTRMYQV